MSFSSSPSWPVLKQSFDPRLNHAFLVRLAQKKVDTLTIMWKDSDMSPPCLIVDGVSRSVATLLSKRISMEFSDEETFVDGQAPKPPSIFTITGGSFEAYEAVFEWVVACEQSAGMKFFKRVNIHAWYHYGMAFVAAWYLDIADLKNDLRKRLIRMSDNLRVDDLRMIFNAMRHPVVPGSPWSFLTDVACRGVARNILSGNFKSTRYEDLMREAGMEHFAFGVGVFIREGQALGLDERGNRNPRSPPRGPRRPTKHSEGEHFEVRKLIQEVADGWESNARPRNVPSLSCPSGPRCTIHPQKQPEATGFHVDPSTHQYCSKRHETPSNPSSESGRDQPTPPEQPELPEEAPRLDLDSLQEFPAMSAVPGRVRNN